MTMQGNTNISYYVFSLIETNIELQEKIWYNLETQKQNNFIDGNNINGNGNSGNNNISSNNDLSPIKQFNNITLEKFPLKLNSNIRIDYLDDKQIRKTKNEIIKLNCISEFKFFGRFYTLNRKPLLKAYCGEDFLFRANIEIQAPCDLDILETYFICVSLLIFFVNY